MANNVKIKIYFGDGTERDACITPAAAALVKRFATFTPSLFEGTGFNPLDASSENIVAVSRADHDLIHQVHSSEQKAAFRLGQMDMRESIIDMLRDEALDASEENWFGLHEAVKLVESMEVPDADA